MATVVRNKVYKTGCGAVYGLGFIGSAVYYLSIAPTFWIGVYGLLKALVWPAILVYQALRYLGA
jgi:hypothetical protein